MSGLPPRPRPAPADGDRRRRGIDGRSAATAALADTIRRAERALEENGPRMEPGRREKIQRLISEANTRLQDLRPPPPPPPLPPVPE